MAKPHEQIHKKVKESVDAFNRGDRQVSTLKAQEVEHLSREIIENLSQLENVIRSGSASKAQMTKKLVNQEAVTAGNGHKEKILA
jgi:hypothetical protein